MIYNIGMYNKDSKMIGVNTYKRGIDSNNEYGQQSSIKRQQLRAQIRRRRVEEYHKGIRNQWLKLQRNEIWKQEENKRRNNQGQVQQFENQSEIYNKQDQRKQILDQLSLSHPQRVCKTEVLSFLRQQISQMYEQKDSQREIERREKISQILVKISINEQYWWRQFVQQYISLLDFIICLQIQGITKNAPHQQSNYFQNFQINVVQILINLSQCKFIQFKTQIYCLLISKEIFFALAKHHHYSRNCFHYSPKLHKNQEYHSLLIILHQFLLEPPLLSHHHPGISLYYLTPSQCISTIFDILIKITQSMNLQWEQNILKIIELIYYMIVRINYSEAQQAINMLYNQKWRLLHISLKKYAITQGESKSNSQLDHRESQIGGSYILLGKKYKNLITNVELKIKYKILQISSQILAWSYEAENQLNRHIGKQYLYAFLPNIFTFLVDDLLNFCHSNSTPLDKKIENHRFISTKANKNSEFNKKYEQQLIQTLYHFINTEDELSELPALEYINLKYSNLFNDISQYYLNQFELPAFSKRCSAIVKSIISKISTHQSESCGAEWFTKYIENEIENFQVGRNQDQFEKVLQSSLRALTNHNHSQIKVCKLFHTLSQNKILNKLQSLVKLYELSRIITQTSETLLEKINHFLGTL